MRDVASLSAAELLEAALERLRAQGVDLPAGSVATLEVAIASDGRVRRLVVERSAARVVFGRRELSDRPEDRPAERPAA